MSEATTDKPTGMRSLAAKGGPQYMRNGKGLTQLCGVMPISESSSLRVRVICVGSDGNIRISAGGVEASLPPAEFTDFVSENAADARAWYLRQKTANPALLPALPVKLRTKSASTSAAQQTVL